MKNEKPPKVDWVNEAWKEACNQVISDIRPRTDEERVSNPVNETPAKGGLTRFVTAEEAYQSDLARVSAQLAAFEARCAEKDEIIKHHQAQLDLYAFSASPAKRHAIALAAKSFIRRLRPANMSRSLLKIFGGRRN